MNVKILTKNGINSVKYNTSIKKDVAIKNIKLNNISDSNIENTNTTNQNDSIFSKYKFI
jgi:hypothetical protein